VYRVRLINMRSSQELEDVRTRFVVGIDRSKATSGPRGTDPQDACGG
jgi:hypothetical protein